MGLFINFNKKLQSSIFVNNNKALSKLDEISSKYVNMKLIILCFYI